VSEFARQEEAANARTRAMLTGRFGQNDQAGPGRGADDVERARLAGAGWRLSDADIVGASTKVVTKASASLSQLSPGANVVAVGQIGPHGVMTASTVAEPAVLGVVLAGGPAKIRPSGCSAAAITTAAVLAGA
jgi:hypothetical protein